MLRPFVTGEKIMKFYRIWGAGLVALALAGCGEPTLEDLKSDPELLDETLKMCRGDVEPDKEDLCQRARRAAAERFGSKIKDMMNGVVDGLQGEK
jgi:hypothetical protein